MKLARLLDANLQNTLKKLNAQPLPLKTAFVLKGITKKINEELAKYDECRLEWLERAGTRDPEGKILVDENNQVIMDPSKQIEFLEGLGELMSSEVEVGALTVEQLGDINISVDDLINLEGIIQ